MPAMKEHRSSTLQWREAPSKPKSSSRRRSRGISPHRFHQHHSNAPESNNKPSFVDKTREDIHHRLVQEGKRRMGQEQELKRGAFKQVTECKSWPLQEPALEHFRALLRHHLPGNDDDFPEQTVTRIITQDSRSSDLETPRPAVVTPTFSEQQSKQPAPGGRLHQQQPEAIFSFSASSSLSSASSYNHYASPELHGTEPKRLLRTLHNSPNKSRFKDYCRQEFLQEQALPARLPPPELNDNNSTQQNQQQLSQPQTDNGRPTVIPVTPAPRKRSDVTTLATPSNAQHDNDINTDEQQEMTRTLLQRPALWSMEPCIWAWELSNTGKRKYIVGHLGRCLDLYWRRTLAENRHGYELIRENTPCRLYLDIEFNKQHNPELNKDDNGIPQFLTALFDDMAQQLHDNFPNELGRTKLERRHVIDLDSTTPKKFSRHWIVHLPGDFLFSSNRAVGRFVHEWMGSLMQRRRELLKEQEQTEPNNNNNNNNNKEEGGPNSNTENQSTRRPLDPALAKYLMVNTKSHSDDNDTAAQSCIVDLGVYTKNRLFRLLGSCKFGKPASAALRIAKENEFPFDENFGNEQFYNGTLSQKESSDKKKSANSPLYRDVPELEVVQQYKASIDWEPHANALAETLVIPINATKIQYPLLPDLPEPTAGSSLPQIPGASRFMGGGSYGRQCYGASPFPLVDQYVLSHLATRGGVQGSIRTWSVEKRETNNNASTPAVLINYFLQRNRFCENVRRHHKSNGIYWQIDCVTYRANQRCFDPECRGFSSNPIAMPKYVRDYIQSTLQEQQQQQDSSLDNASTATTVDVDSLSNAVHAISLSSNNNVAEERSITTTISTVEDDAEEQHSFMPIIRNNPYAKQPKQSGAVVITQDTTDATTFDDTNFDLDFLSDDALLAAVSDHPELFP